MLRLFLLPLLLIFLPISTFATSPPINQQDTIQQVVFSNCERYSKEFKHSAEQIQIAAVQCDHDCLGRCRDQCNDDFDDNREYNKCLDQCQGFCGCN